MAVLLPLLLLSGVATPEPVVGAVEWSEDCGQFLIEVRLLNASDASQTADLPEEVEARLSLRSREWTIRAKRTADAPATVTVQPRSFADAHYQMSLPADAGPPDGALVEVPGWGARRVTALHGPEDPPTFDSGAPRSTAAAPSVTVTTAAAAYNDFLPNLSAYEPIYAVYGPGTDSDARLQISFRYQLFGAPAAPDRRTSWAQGIYFAYTQRMFWDLGARSSPFHNIDFMPELFYLAPSAAIGGGAMLGGQAGFRHESNGRSGDDSRSLNTIYIQPQLTLPIGRYILTAGSRLWIYAGSLSDNPDVRRYRGNSGFSAQIGEENGLKLGVGGRMNFGSGKGALDANVSYPVDRIFGGGLNLYLFGQAFAGYGENLLDYDRRVTRVRAGIAIVR